MKNITIDIRTAGLFGPSCKFVELLQSYHEKGYKINLLAKDWSVFGKGLTFDKDKKDFDKGDSKLIWDPGTHPKDYFVNLILPSFDNINYIKEYKDGIFGNFIKTFLDPNYISYNTYTSMHMEKIEMGRYLQQKKELQTPKLEINKFVVRNTKKYIKTLLQYLSSIVQLKIIRHYKIKTESKGFRYKISEELKDKNLISFIQKAKTESVKYILISVLWDEGMQFENQKDRLKGGPVIYPDSHDKIFEDLKNYVRKLDEYALKTGKIKFLLASKKAVDWSNFLKSDYLDLRNFEEYGFTLSQSIYAAQELSSATINWPSTYTIWITNCSDIIHLTWYDNKDTAKWARNNLHLGQPKDLIELICQ